MRNLIFLAVVLVFSTPVAQAQQPRDDTSRTTAAVDGSDAGAGAGVDMDAGADAAGTTSGFGQVMSVLTGLLQDAAQREATGRSDGFVLDNPAIEISVTPAEGRTSLLRKPTARSAAVEPKAKARHAAAARELAGTTPR